MENNMKNYVLGLLIVICGISCVSNKSDSNETLKQYLEKGKLVFHIIDLNATQEFNDYYKKNPNSTFNEQGELLDPRLLPTDMSLREFLAENLYRKNEINREFGFTIKKQNSIDESERIIEIWFHGNETGEWELSNNDTRNTSIKDFPRYLVTEREVALDGKHIIDVQIEQNKSDHENPVVHFSLDEEGGEIFNRKTSSNVGRAMAIIFNDVIREIVFIGDSIKDKVSIECSSIEEINNLAFILKSGSSIERK
jgi:hypothetical protein